MIGMLALSAMSSADQLVDPTKPLGVSEESLTLPENLSEDGVRLSAIVNTQQGRIAIINDHIMRAGDVRSGVTVKHIDVDSVVVDLVINGITQERRLRVSSAGDIKKNATETF